VAEKREKKNSDEILAKNANTILPEKHARILC